MNPTGFCGHRNRDGELAIPLLVNITGALSMMICAIVATAAPAQPTPNRVVVDPLADRILECRHAATGAIFIKPLSKRAGGLTPYFGHFAAYGLLRAFEATEKPEYLRAGDDWIDWYRERQRPDGAVA